MIKLYRNIEGEWPVLASEEMQPHLCPMDRQKDEAGNPMLAHIWANSPYVKGTFLEGRMPRFGTADMTYYKGYQSVVFLGHFDPTLSSNSERQFDLWAVTETDDTTGSVSCGQVGSSGYWERRYFSYIPASTHTAARQAMWNRAFAMGLLRDNYATEIVAAEHGCEAHKQPE